MFVLRIETHTTHTNTYTRTHKLLSNLSHLLPNRNYRNHCAKPSPLFSYGLEPIKARLLSGLSFYIFAYIIFIIVMPVAFSPHGFIMQAFILFTIPCSLHKGCVLCLVTLSNISFKFKNRGSDLVLS